MDVKIPEGCFRFSVDDFVRENISQTQDQYFPFVFYYTKNVRVKSPMLESDFCFVIEFFKRRIYRTQIVKISTVRIES